MENDMKMDLLYDFDHVNKEWILKWMRPIENQNQKQIGFSKEEPKGLRPYGKVRKHRTDKNKIRLEIGYRI